MNTYLHTYICIYMQGYHVPQTSITTTPSKSVFHNYNIANKLISIYTCVTYIQHFKTISFHIDYNLTHDSIIN